jgi:hypothetical protein
LIAAPEFTSGAADDATHFRPGGQCLVSPAAGGGVLFLAKELAMSLDRHSIVLSVLSASLFLSPVVPQAGQCSAAPELARPIGRCEAALAACMNSGGDTDACWNAYWRCISR